MVPSILPAFLTSCGLRWPSRSGLIPEAPRLVASPRGAGGPGGPGLRVAGAGHRSARGSATCKGEENPPGETPQIVDLCGFSIGKPGIGKCWYFMGFYGCGKTHIAIENGPVEIVAFPINSMVDLSTAMLVITRGYSGR